MTRRHSLFAIALVWSAAAGCGNKAAKPGVGSGGASGTAAGASGAAGGGNPVTGGGSQGGAATGSGAIPTAPIDREPVQDADDATLGVNLALAALGGRVVSPSDPAEVDPAWRVANLIDGLVVVAKISRFDASSGWRPAAGLYPQELVFAFRDNRQATIAAVVVDTLSATNLMSTAAVPRDVEVQVSTTSATDGFTKIATASLPADAGPTRISFPPTPATWVKLVLASGHDAGVAPELCEVQIYEAAAGPSIVADLPKNLLLPALGGSLVRFTSQAEDAFAAELVDGIVDDKLGWSSHVAPDQFTARFPQELTFAFRDHRAALIDRIVIDPTSGMLFYSGPRPNVSTWPKTIEVQTSVTSPWEGFTTERVIDVPAVAKPVEVPIGRSIRFIRLRILTNHGGDRTTLGEVSAFEGAPPAGRSILAGRPVPLARLDGSAVAAGNETAARREREPNETQQQADPLDSPAPVGGISATLGDRDVFVVRGAPGPGKQTLTVSVEGRPAIRSRITVLDGAGTTRYELDPARLVGATTRFSVVTDPGDLFVRIVQPPSAQVVIWDSSGSMERRVADLDAALRGYLGKTLPGDRVQLIRFDDTIEVLLKDFSSDGAALVAALADKVYANGGTSIYDAVGKGLEALDKAGGTRAILLLTDGEDTSSTTDPAGFWRALDHNRVRLYAIGLGNGLRDYVPRAGAIAERVLADAAVATGGRYAFVADSARLGALYDEIGAELRAPATYAIAATMSSGSGTLAVRSTGDRLAVPLRVELVLDASGSMKRKVGGRTMMDAAKGVLTDLVTRLPASATVALRVYGHRTPEKRAGACEDSELVTPFGPLDRKRLAATIKRVKPLGTTPIAHSITAAGEDLKDAKGTAMLIVVTDGREECGGDPAAAVAALRTAGLDVTVNVVGFGLTDAADLDAMAKVAAAGGGRFFDAQGEAGLRAAVDDALAVPFTVVDATGAVLARGVVGADPIAVPTGDLTVRIDSAATPIVIDHVVVEAGKPTVVELDKDGDDVSARIGAPGMNQP